MVAKAKGNRRLIAVCVVVYIACLIALMPLNVLYRAFEPTNLPVEVLSVSGTLWQGSAVVRHATTGQVTASWTLSPLYLFMGRVQAQLTADASTFDFKSQVTFNGLNQTLHIEQASGLVSAGLVNKLIAQSKAQLSGDIELNQANIEYNLATGESPQASGQVVWLGGQVQYPKGRKMASATLPMLVAKISSENNELSANVSTTQGEQVATGSLKKDGWANLAVRKAMIDLVGEKWPNKASADTVVFEISERIFTRQQ